MSILKPIIVGTLAVSLGSCSLLRPNGMEANVEDVLVTTISNNELYSLEKSCNEPKDARLNAADHYMEQIVKAGGTNKKSNPELNKAGNALLVLAKDFYSDSMSPEECKEKVSKIRGYLDLAKVNFN